MTEQETQDLIDRAATARDAAYAPYSGFAVGAALLGEDGTIYTGCNVENASYGLTMCAERNALFHAVAQGQQRFVAIAVVTSTAVTPCGACRQVLAEFNPQMQVIVADTEGHRYIYRVAELLPAAFGPEQLLQSKA